MERNTHMENVKKVIEPPRREDAKGFIYFLIGVTDREKNHALRANHCFKLFTIRFMPLSFLKMHPVIKNQRKT